MAFKRIAVLGCGLIGGSFALGLKKNGYAGEVVGWDREEVLRKAGQRGAVDRQTTELAAAVAGADLIYLSTPVMVILDLLPQVGRHAEPGALITDTGSTKVRICRLARQVLPESIAFLGGHPIAGKEVSGIENAEPDLFAGAEYVVIKDAKERGRAEEEFLGWLRRLGAEPAEMDAERHDWAAALVSHAPQLLSTALASAVWDEADEDTVPFALAGSGLRDMTRLAGSPYEVWRDICLTNSENLERVLEQLEARLERMRTHLHSKDLAEEFEKARRMYAALRSKEGRR